VAVTIGKRLGTTEYTLDVDATVIESEKQEARWTYKKVKGYQPLLGFLAETGVCVAHEFREGNAAAQSGALKFLGRCLKRCPRIKRLRSDSAFYQGRVMDFCRERGLGFTITADQTAGVKEVIKTVRDWKRLRTAEGEETDREVGTAIHLVMGAQEAVRLVVQRWQLIETAGRLVRHGRSWVLRIAASLEKWTLFRKVRLACLMVFQI